MAFTPVLIIFMVGGTLWIILHLYYRMMVSGFVERWLVADYLRQGMLTVPPNAKHRPGQRLI